MQTRRNKQSENILHFEVQIGGLSASYYVNIITGDVRCAYEADDGTIAIVDFDDDNNKMLDLAEKPNPST